MGKPAGFLEYKRSENKMPAPEDRIKNFGGLYIPAGEAERRDQAARCMDCGVPFCQYTMALNGKTTGCPLHNLMPEWNNDVYMGRYAQAYQRLSITNNFPEFTGRVCPALCEKACLCGVNDAPVTIRDNECFIIEKAFRNGVIQPRIPKVRSGKSVAVVGSGPAGLAVADMLNQRGHTVTVYERDDRIGGLLMYGIPNMKLPKEIVERRQRLMEQEGVTFKTNVDIGNDISGSDLMKDHDAVVLCCGARKPRPLSIAVPETAENCMDAVDFLTDVTKDLLAERLTAEGKRKKDALSPDIRKKHVVIVGGGDTANDCVGTAMRLGASSVVQLIRRPAPPEKRGPDNPWPDYPNVLVTGYGQQEAEAVFGHDPRMFSTMPADVVLDENGQIEKLVITDTVIKNGRVQAKKGTEREIPCDLLIAATGFSGCEPYVPESFGVEPGKRGTLNGGELGKFQAAEGLFTAGDMRRGSSLVVWAIAEGRACASEVDRYLMGYTELPSYDEDL